MSRSRTLALGLAAALALAGTAIAAAPPALGSAAATESASTLTKSVQNVTSPGTIPANHGDVVNWVLSYNGAADPGTATVTDQVQSGQTYEQGSLKVPPGWTPSWSTDGSNFSTTEPVTGVIAVRGSDPEARAGGTNLSRFLLPPVQTVATPTGGDGFSPVIYRGPGGAVEAWNMYHHTGAAAPKVVCTNLLTNQPCAGGPWPRPANTAPGALGSGNTGDIASTLVPQYVTDPEHPERVYYPAITAGSVGFGCLDMQARANCGYVSLHNRASNVNNVEGVVTVGGKIYGVDSSGAVLCADLATFTACAGQPYAAVAPGNNPSGGYYSGSLVVVSGQVFISSYASGRPYLGCFDPASSTACADWASARLAGPSGSTIYSVFASYATSGAPNGACVPLVSGSAPIVTCFGLDGSALAAPAPFSGVTPGALTFDPRTIVAPNGHLTSYFPFWGGSLGGGTGCYDWTTAAACAGMPFPKTHPNVNGGAVRDYGYAYDQTTQCLLGLGDAGYLFSLDPLTGATPCLHSGAAVTLNPGAFYCDNRPHAQAYTTARLNHLTLSNVDLANSTAQVTDPDGNVLLTPAFAPDGTLDISSISPAAEPSIIVTASLVLLSTADFGGGNQPSLIVEYQGDAPQICFKTRLSSACEVTGVSNTATGSDPGGILTSNKADVPIKPGPACQPVVSVNKEICTDLRASRCGPEGPGPWAKSTPAGLLGLLGTAYWRISVTNSGQVGAANLTLNDQATPGCVSAAGTFTLAPGETKRFYCSSYLLVLPLTNTASANYVAAGSPPGTPPSTSASSSATACSLICILLPGGHKL